MDKRASLRQHYQTEDYQKKLDEQHKQRLEQIDNLENNMIKSFDALIRFINGNITKTEIINQIKSVSTPDVDKVTQAIQKLDEHVLSQKVDLKPLESGLNSLKRELSLIPKTLPKIPKQKDEIAITNLDEIVLDTKDLEKAIKALKLHVEAPNIITEKVDLTPLQNVMLDLLKSVNNQKYPEFPKIPKFPKTDLSKVEKKLDESNKHLKGILEKRTGSGGGGGTGTSYKDSTGKLVYVQLESDGSIPVTSSSSYYAIKLDDTSTANVTYVGKAAVGSSGASAVWQIQKIDESSGLVITYADGDSNFNNTWNNRTSLSYS